MIDKWADEVSEICKKYSGKDWILVFNSTEDGYDFHGFVGVEIEGEDNEVEQRQ